MNKFFSYLILFILYGINGFGLYKVVGNIRNNNYKIGFVVNKICSFVLLLIFTIYYKKFLIINLIEMSVITLFYSLNSLLEISESNPTIRLLSILKTKKKYIFMLTLIGLFLIIFISNYFFLLLLKNLFSSMFSTN